MKVVLDTNSLLVSIGRKSKFRPIFNALIKNEITLLITNDIILEYFEVIENKTNIVVAKNVIDFLLSTPNVQKIDIHFRWSLISKDFDDNKFVDCAINGQANYLITDDKHFKNLNEIQFPLVKIIKTKEFLMKLKR